MFVSVAFLQAWTSDPTPLWKVDLQQLGYVRPIRVSLAFIDSRHVAIAWISPDRKQNKEPKWGDAAHVHVVVLNGTTGQKEAEKAWPTRFTGWNPALAGASDNSFIICTDDALRLLSTSLDVVREHHLPGRSTCKPSPSGHTILVVSLSESSRQLTVMDSATFKASSEWTEQRQSSEEAIATSDAWLLGYCGKPTELCVRRFGGSWRALHVPGVETQTTDQRRIPASFINNETLAIRDKTTTLATVEGSTLFHVSPSDKRLSPSRVVPSSNGETFAIVEERLRGAKIEEFDMYPFYADDRVAVYGIRDHDNEFSLKLQGTSPWTPWHTVDNVIALSPDGDSLGLVSDGVIEVFAIPHRGSTKH